MFPRSLANPLRCSYAGNNNFTWCVKVLLYLCAIMARKTVLRKISATSRKEAHSFRPEGAAWFSSSKSRYASILRERASNLGHVTGAFDGSFSSTFFSTNVFKTLAAVVICSRNYRTTGAPSTPTTVFSLHSGSLQREYRCAREPTLITVPRTRSNESFTRRAFDAPAAALRALKRPFVQTW